MTLIALMCFAVIFVILALFYAVRGQYSVAFAICALPISLAVGLLGLFGSYDHVQTVHISALIFSAIVSAWAFFGSRTSPDRVAMDRFAAGALALALVAGFIAINQDKYVPGDGKASAADSEAEEKATKANSDTEEVVAAANDSNDEVITIEILADILGITVEEVQNARGDGDENGVLHRYVTLEDFKTLETIIFGEDGDNGLLATSNGTATSVAKIEEALSVFKNDEGEIDFGNFQIWLYALEEQQGFNPGVIADIRHRFGEYWDLEQMSSSNHDPGDPIANPAVGRASNNGHLFGTPLCSLNPNGLSGANLEGYLADLNHSADEVIEECAKELAGRMTRSNRQLAATALCVWASPSGMTQYDCQSGLDEAAFYADVEKLAASYDANKDLRDWTLLTIFGLNGQEPLIQEVSVGCFASGLVVVERYGPNGPIERQAPRPAECEHEVTLSIDYRLYGGNDVTRIDYRVDCGGQGSFRPVEKSPPKETTTTTEASTTTSATPTTAVGRPTTVPTTATSSTSTSSTTSTTSTTVTATVELRPSARAKLKCGVIDGINQYTIDASGQNIEYWLINGKQGSPGDYRAAGLQPINVALIAVSPSGHQAPAIMLIGDGSCGKDASKLPTPGNKGSVPNTTTTAQSITTTEATRPPAITGTQPETRKKGEPEGDSGSIDY